MTFTQVYDEDHTLQGILCYQEIFLYSYFRRRKRVRLSKEKMMASHINCLKKAIQKHYYSTQ